MKKGTNWYRIYLLGIAVIMLSTSIAFGQEDKVNINGKNIDLSSDGDSVKIGPDGISIHSKEDTSVEKPNKKSVTKVPSATSPQSETLTFSKDATISGRQIITDGNGLILKGNGDYTLADCNIMAGKNAIIVSGNATVSIKNCVIQGDESAVLIKDNGTVKASKNVITGKIKKQDNADYIDKGGNQNNS